ncbi:MAG: LPS export ABC transporter periplasmic protein LptC [candidate division WOR-3 bacterium]
MPKLIRINQRRFLFLLFSILFACFCKKPTPKTNPEPIPNQIVEAFKLTESVSGKKFYQLKATKAYLFESLNKIEVIAPEIVFFDSDGKEFSILVAKSGTVNNQTSDLIARQEVVVRTSDSTYLYTDSLVWLNNRQIVTTDAWVKIKSPQGDIEGQGLIADAGLTKIEVKSAVKGKSNYQFEK